MKTAFSVYSWFIEEVLGNWGTTIIRVPQLSARVCLLFLLEIALCHCSSFEDLF